MSDFHEFGYDGKDPVPAGTTAQAYADALDEYLTARDELKIARGKVPSYTGQWSSKDYYAAEQERYYRAVDALGNAVRRF